jgi:hypothetical protein
LPDNPSIPSDDEATMEKEDPTPKKKLDKIKNTTIVTT